MPPDGRYRLSTTRRVARERGFGPETRFTAGVQDAPWRWCCRGCWTVAVSGGRWDGGNSYTTLHEDMGRAAAAQWAVVYEGHANNKAMTWAALMAEWCGCGWG
jgi:hypothetical protein